MTAAHTFQRTVLLAALFAVLTASLLVAGASHAALSTSTDNSTSTFNADQIQLTDNDDDQALFDVTGMTPGQVEERCLTVSYAGASNADVNLYASAGQDDFAEFLDLTVDADTAPASTTTSGDFSCPGDFTATDSVQAATKLDSFLATAVDYDSGVGGLTLADGDDVVFRFIVEFDDSVADPDAAQGTAVDDLTFTWEAQNT